MGTMDGVKIPLGKLTNSIGLKEYLPRRHM
jgi:hypothetical protein